MEFALTDAKLQNAQVDISVNTETVSLNQENVKLTNNAEWEKNVGMESVKINVLDLNVGKDQSVSKGLVFLMCVQNRHAQRVHFVKIANVFLQFMLALLNHNTKLQHVLSQDLLRKNALF